MSHRQLIGNIDERNKDQQALCDLSQTSPQSATMVSLASTTNSYPLTRHSDLRQTSSKAASTTPAGADADVEESTVDWGCASSPEVVGSKPFVQEMVEKETFVVVVSFRR